jgi:hypothetical protein
MPTVICPRCKNDTLVLEWSSAVKHCATCGGVLPDLDRLTNERSRAAQAGLEGAIEGLGLSRRRGSPRARNRVSAPRSGELGPG